MNRLAVKRGPGYDYRSTHGNQGGLVTAWDWIVLVCTIYAIVFGLNALALTGKRIKERRRKHGQDGSLRN